MHFIYSFDNMFVFSNHNVTHMNVSKQYNENRGVRALLTIRKHQINLPPSSNFLPKMVPLTGVEYRSLILWGTVNLYLVTGYRHNRVVLCIVVLNQIMKTCPCNEDPRTPHFYIVKWGFQGYSFFSFFFCSKT